MTITVSPNSVLATIDHRISIAHYPVEFSSNERATMNLEHVLSVLANDQAHSPLVYAQVDLNDACPTIKAINDVYEDSIPLYRAQGLVAAGRDRQTVRIESNVWKRIFFSGKFTPWVAPVIYFNPIVGGVLVIAAAGMGYYEDRKNVIRECCIHRKAWLHEIHVKETSRIDDAKTRIVTRAKVVVNLLNAAVDIDSQDMEEDENLLKELRQLDSCFSGFFAKKDLIVEIIRKKFLSLRTQNESNDTIRDALLPFAVLVATLSPEKNIRSRFSYHATSIVQDKNREELTDLRDCFSFFSPNEHLTINGRTVDQIITSWR